MSNRGVKGRFITSGEKRKLDNLRPGGCKKRLIDIDAQNCCQTNSSDKIDWNEGKRVVDLGLLAKSLQKCSFSECQSQLSLLNIERETRVGLSSILWVRCASCGEMNKIYTSKTHEHKQQGRPIFDINTKLATGLIHSGLSIASVQRFLECLEIPPPSSKCFKAREREVGPVVERI